MTTDQFSNNLSVYKEREKMQITQYTFFLHSEGKSSTCNKRIACMGHSKKGGFSQSTYNQNEFFIF